MLSIAAETGVVDKVVFEQVFARPSKMTFPFSSMQALHQTVMIMEHLEREESIPLHVGEEGSSEDQCRADDQHRRHGFP